MSKVFLPWLAGGIKYSLRGCEKLCPGWLERGIISQPAWAELLHTLSKNIFSSFQPARAEILHTLSKNIFSSFQPARAELLHTLSKIILFLLYNQPGQSFYTPYQRIFFLLPISQGIAFTHPLKEYFYNLNWNVKRTNDQAFRLSSRNDLAVEIRSQNSDSHIPGQLLSNGQMSLTNQYKYKLKSKKKFKNIINNILYSWCNKNIVMLCSLTFLSRSINANFHFFTFTSRPRMFHENSYRTPCFPWLSRSDFCETLILISKLRLSRQTLISFSISTLNFSLRTLILILNSQNFSNSHSRIST